MNAFRVASTCGVCGAENLTGLWELPSLPLTETYGVFTDDYPNFDQEVQICEDCGHFQLGNRVSPDFLYSPENYAFQSLAAKRAVEEKLFVDFISRFIPDSVGSILEFGANDLSLANQLAKLGKQVIAVDPLVSQAPADKKISTFPAMVEHFLEAETQYFDLIVARHTLEHVDNPLRLLSRIFERVSRRGVVALEFPSLDLLVASQRGDAFFHQHYHYFDLASVHRLARGLGVNILGYSQNRQGSNGGSIMVALGTSGALLDLSQFEASRGIAFGTERASNRAIGFEKFRSGFVAQMENMITLIDLNKPLVGLGAGLMTPIFDYHLKGAIGHLPMILDDDSSKHGTSYRNLDVPIKLPNKASLPPGFSALITSLENPKPMFARAVELGAQKVLGLSVS